MGILRLSHVEIRVPDLELATAYYSEVVGLIETAIAQRRLELVRVDLRTGSSELSLGEDPVVAGDQAELERA